MTTNSKKHNSQINIFNNYIISKRLLYDYYILNNMLVVIPVYFLAQLFKSELFLYLIPRRNLNIFIMKIGCIYSLSKLIHKLDADGNKKLTFPCQDNKGHRKAKIEYSTLLFGNEVIIETNRWNPHKQWAFGLNQTHFVLRDNSKYGLKTLSA